MSDTTTFSIRITKPLLDRIDRAAAQAGETRSTYILSWLPEYYDRDTPDSQRHNANNDR